MPEMVSDLPLPIHPVAQSLPEITEQEREQLRASIVQQGQLQPVIVSHDSQIIDGRHRMQVCMELHRPLLVHRLPRDANLQAVSLTANMHRRHLSESQRAMIAASLVTTRQGVSRTEQDVSQEDAARYASCSLRYIRDAYWLLHSGLSEAIDDVRNGRESLRSVVARLRTLDNAQALRARTPRPILVDQFPEQNFAPAEIPQPGVHLITHAVQYIVSTNADAAEWLGNTSEWTAEQRESAVRRLEDFARLALDIIEEQTPAPAPTPRRRSRSNDEDADAHRDIIVERGGSSTGGARVRTTSGEAPV
jgi:hypothetical protein